MRIIELLARLRALLTSELRAFVDALPTTLDALRDALQATVDQCAALFTNEHRTVRRRKPRLSRGNACRNLFYMDDLIQDVAAAAIPNEDEQSNVPEDPLPRVLSLAELAHAHELVERASRLEAITSDDERTAHAHAVAQEIDAYLQSTATTPTSAQDEQDDAVAVEADASMEAVASDDEEEKAAPPSSTISEWDEPTPGVAMDPRELQESTPKWNSDWTVNQFASLQADSETTSDAPSPPGSSVSVEEVVVPMSTVDTESPPQSVEPDNAVADEPPLSFASMLHLLTTGVSYRQLTEELAEPTSDETSTVFYRAALQKLKQERSMRSRLRSASNVSDVSIDSVSSTSSAVGPGPLRPMRVTPLVPQYDNDQNDASRLQRKKKIENLRQRTTPFAIKIGQPLSTRRLENPAADGA